MFCFLMQQCIACLIDYTIWLKTKQEIHQRAELIGLKANWFGRKGWGEEKKKEEAAGGGGNLWLGDHKGNYLHWRAKSPIKPESTTQSC